MPGRMGFDEGERRRAGPGRSGADGRRAELGPGAEFDRIRGILGRFPGRLPSHVRVGPGDDAAALEPGSVVVSTDMTVEDVHFRRAWVGDEEVGYRATAAALSDLAAMAASPLGVLVSIAVPRAASDAPGATRARAADDRSSTGGAPAGPGSEGILDGLAAGVADACAVHETVLLGGDLCTSPGPVVVDVVAVGQTLHPVTRGGARPGDEVWVTGRLGGSASAVTLWRSGRTPPPALRTRFSRPTARIPEAVWLVERAPVRALIDLSDGLFGDLGHVAAASGVRAVVDAWAVPVCLESSAALGDERAAELALAGGEDYELCLVCGPTGLDDLAEPFRRRFETELTRVGTIEAGSGVYQRPAPGEPPVAAYQGGFDHFAGERDR